jgi:nucleotide-binding universal stress UspA family protein
MKRNILAAVDGSVFSFNALRYLSHLFTDLEDIFVHLLYIVPTGFQSPDRGWLDDFELMCRIGPKARGLLAKGKRFMEEAVLQLGRRGIAPEQVTTTVRPARGGIAADILFEARNGLYDALLIGRRGIGKLEEMFMGSVSAAIVDTCFDLPIWIVDGKVNSRRFLLPVDGTFNSLKAADHLGFILKDNPYAEITLFHLAALFADEAKKINRQALHEIWGEEWCMAHLEKDDSLYSAPEQLLLEHGISPSRIKRFSKDGGISAPKHILRRSVIDKHGTIVIGRRGKHVKKGILKGVSENVLRMANGVAVWIV